MKFTKVEEGTICDCFSDASENSTDLFVRKVRVSQSLKDPDFRNHIERKKNPNNEDDCSEVCGLHALSFEIWSELSSDLLMKKYQTTVAISPQSKKNLCIVKFKPNSGLVKYTPNQEEYNEFHYDFYKIDDFTVANLELVDMIQITAS